VFFEDLAKCSGLTVPNTSGGKTRKDYILETTGNGVVVFDYDGDGAEDIFIFIANGTTLDVPKGSARLPQLYHNDGHGRFSEVGKNAGFAMEGWAKESVSAIMTTTAGRTCWSPTTEQIACIGISATARSGT
jgi:enediyne biosynthesis protein E4